MTKAVHTHTLTVYYEDTDAGGVVYYARYLAFAERARTEFLRAHGLSNTSILDAHGVYLVVAEVHAKYHASARLEDDLTIQTSVSFLKNASFGMQHLIVRGDATLVTMAVRLAAMDAKTGKPVRLPESLYAVLNENL